MPDLTSKIVLPMRFDIITLFPELFAPFMQSGINRRAFEVRKRTAANWWMCASTNPRDFADGNYRRVDDRPFRRWPRHGHDGRGLGPLC